MRGGRGRGRGGGVTRTLCVGGEFKRAWGGGEVSERLGLNVREWESQ